MGLGAWHISHPKDHQDQEPEEQPGGPELEPSQRGLQDPFQYQSTGKLFSHFTCISSMATLNSASHTSLAKFARDIWSAAVEVSMWLWSGHGEGMSLDMIDTVPLCRSAWSMVRRSWIRKDPTRLWMTCGTVSIHARHIVFKQTHPVQYSAVRQVCAYACVRHHLVWLEPLQ